MRALRTILILSLIVLRPVLLAVLWPVAVLARFATFGSPLVLFFLVVVLLHTADPAQRSFAWSLIATMAGFALASAGLADVQRKLREDPTLWFGGWEPRQEPFRPWQGRDFRARPGIAIAATPYPRSLAHFWRR